MPVAAKTVGQLILVIKLTKAIFKKIFGGELIIRTLSTTPLQIICKSMLHSKVIFKSMTDPDDIGQVNLMAWMG